MAFKENYHKKNLSFMADALAVLKDIMDKEKK